MSSVHSRGRETVSRYTARTGVFRATILADSLAVTAVAPGAADAVVGLKPLRAADATIPSSVDDASEPGPNVRPILTGSSVSRYSPINGYAWGIDY